MSQGTTFFDVLEENPQQTAPAQPRTPSKGVTFHDVLEAAPPTPSLSHRRGGYGLAESAPAEPEAPEMDTRAMAVADRFMEPQRGFIAGKAEPGRVPLHRLINPQQKVPIVHPTTDLEIAASEPGVFDVARQYYTRPEGGYEHSAFPGGDIFDRAALGAGQGAVDVGEFFGKAIPEAVLLPPQTTAEEGVQAVVGAGGLAGKRLLVDPQVHAAERAEELAHEGRTSESLGYSVAAGIPVFGPVAAGIGEEVGRDPIAGAARALPLAIPLARGPGIVRRMMSPRAQPSIPFFPRVAEALREGEGPAKAPTAPEPQAARPEPIVGEGKANVAVSPSPRHDVVGIDADTGLPVLKQKAAEAQGPVIGPEVEPKVAEARPAPPPEPPIRAAEPAGAPSGAQIAQAPVRPQPSAPFLPAGEESLLEPRGSEAPLRVPFVPRPVVQSERPVPRATGAGIAEERPQPATAPETAGQAGERGSLSLKPVNPPPTPRLAAIREAQDRGPAQPSIPIRLKELYGTVKRRYYDQFVDIRNDLRAMEKRGVKLEASKNPDAILDIVYGGTGGKFQAEAIEFRRILEQSEKAGVRDWVRDYLNLTGYRRAIRIIEERAATEVEQGARSEYQRKLAEGGIVPQYKSVAEVEADLVAMEKRLGAQRFAEVKRTADQVFARTRKAWNLAYEAGIIPRAVYEQGIRRGPEYIPLERIIDDIQSERFQGVSGLDLKQQRVLSRLEGSERFNRNPIAASLDKVVETIREVERNRAAKTAINALLRDKDALALQTKKLAPGEKPASGLGRVSFYEKGEKVTYAVPAPWADALNLAEVAELDGIGSTVLRVSSRVFKTAATGANIPFAAKNVPRDIQDVFLLSKAGARSPVDIAAFQGRWLKNYKDILTQNDKYLSFLRSGAAFSTLQKQISPETFLRLEREGIASKANVPGRVIDTLVKLNNAAEEATKMTVYETLVARGVPHTEAVIETRRFGGSPDFARRGQSRFSRPVDLAFMFFNAGLQGTGRSLRRGFGITTNPKTWGAAAAATLLLYSHNGQFVSEDGSRELDHVSQADRRNSWIILRPETYQTTEGNIRHRYFKIPKPQDLRALFNALEDATDQAVTGEFKPGETALRAVGEMLPGQFEFRPGEMVESVGRGAVSSANPVIREPIEQLMGEGGFDAFRGTPIVPRRLQDVTLPEQKTPATSPTAVTLAEKLNASPLRVEHAVRGVFAGLGEQGLAIADLFAKKRSGGDLLEGDQAVSRFPLFGPVARGFVGSPVDEVERKKSEKFYRHLDLANEARRTYKHLERTDPGRAREYLQDSTVVVYAFLQPGLAKNAETLSQIRDAIRKVQELEGVPVEKRKQAIRTLNKEREKILDYGEQVDSLLRRFNGGQDRR